MPDSSQPSRTSALSSTGQPEPTGPAITFFPVPHRGKPPAGRKWPVWRVRFDILNSPGLFLGLDINGEATLGRGIDTPDMVDLTPFGGEQLGVSRHHATLRPTPTNLFLIDAGSKNGTLRNGQPLGANIPYPLVSGDTLMLGKLKLGVTILDRPPLEATGPAASFAAVVSKLAKAITSQTSLDDVLNKIAEAAMTLTAAGETGIWLVDEQSGEIFMEAQRGIDDEYIRRLRIPVDDPMVGKVISDGQTLRAEREPGHEKLKLKTGYLVEAVLLLPISQVGKTLGALMAVHRKPGQTFTEKDEEILTTIAEFAAIAIQNARMKESTDEALQRRVTELDALNKLTEKITSTLDIDQVHELLIDQVKQQWDVEDVILWLAEDGGQVQPFQVDDETVSRIVAGSAGQVQRIIDEVIQSGEPKTADFLNQEDEVSGSGKKATIKIQARSIACIPLRIKGRVTGVLSLFRKKSGMFNADDQDHLKGFANPVAIAIQNAQLFAISERQREAIQTTANTLIQPLLFLDEDGSVLISNQPAADIVQNHMSELFNGLSEHIGTTTELEIGPRTYLTTSQHSPGIGTVVVMQDITYVKQLEKERVEFVYALTHDLKSPITSIKGWAQLLDKVAPLGDKGNRFVGQIVNSSNQMVRMIDDVLHSMSKEEHIQVNMQACDLKAVTQRAIDDLKGGALSKSLRVTFEKPQGDLTILADERRLYHLMLNLINNAIKYTPDGGRVEVKLEADEKAIRLVVRDNGPGISEDELPHIFEKYFRAKAVQNIPGAGLGLSVVRAVARAHGGDAVAANNPDGGAQFTVTLPRSLEVEKAPA